MLIGCGSIIRSHDYNKLTARFKRPQVADLFRFKASSWWHFIKISVTFTNIQSCDYDYQNASKALSRECIRWFLGDGKLQHRPIVCRRRPRMIRVNGLASRSTHTVIPQGITAAFIEPRSILRLFSFLVLPKSFHEDAKRGYVVAKWTTTAISISSLQIIFRCCLPCEQDDSHLSANIYSITRTISRTFACFGKLLSAGPLEERARCDGSARSGWRKMEYLDDFDNRRATRSPNKRSYVFS